jgi:GntR family histidine utilization transcriptional repressor
MPVSGLTRRRAGQGVPTKYNPRTTHEVGVNTTTNARIAETQDRPDRGQETPAKAMPAYEQIKRYVIRRISEGDWKPGGLIPS